MLGGVLQNKSMQKRWQMLLATVKKSTNVFSLKILVKTAVKRNLSEKSDATYTIGCFTKTLFQKKNKRNPPRISLGVGLKESKRIFHFDKV